MSQKSTATIALVGDDTITRLAQARQLRQAGYRVMEGASGNEAPPLAAQRPDLLILDLQSPGAAGGEVCGTLKRNPTTASTMILLLAATFPNSDDGTPGTPLAADGYLRSPADPGEFLLQVRLLLRLRPRGTPSQNADSGAGGEPTADAEHYITRDPSTETALAQDEARARSLAAERVRTEEALRETMEKFSLALEVGHAGIWEWHRGSNEVHLDARFHAMLGYASGELPTQLEAWLTYHHPEDVPVWQAKVEAYLEGRSPIYESEHRIRNRAGTWDWVLTRGKLIQINATEAPGRFIGIAMKVTDRRRAEEALRENLLFRREAEKIARMGAWKANPQTDFLYWTEGVHEILEAPPDYRPGFAVGLRIFAAESIPVLREALERAFDLGTPFAMELRATTLAGKELWTEIRGLRRVQEGEEAYVMGTFQDITQRKHLEAQLRQAQKLEAIGQLAGGVAHDFNNILAAMVLQLDWLRLHGDADAERRGVLEDLQAEARRAAELTRQLLMFGQRAVLAVKPLNLNEVVENLLRMLRRLIGDDMVLRFDEKTARPWIEADASMMEQVLLNLVVNARDAMPRGGRITIATTTVTPDPADPATHPDRRPGYFVCLAVSDSGCGMDAATRKRIFEPFFTTKAVGKGTGLGLATVHGIVAQQKGWVEVDSEVGMGSTFRVYLPEIPPPAAAATPSESAEPIPRGSGTLLLVEDEPTLRRVTGRTLRAQGYQVHEAGNGKEAMALWRQHGPRVDLLLTDMVMPEGMTGLELAEQLQSLKPGLKAIIASGYGLEATPSSLKSERGIVYLAKPYAAEALITVVRDCLKAGS